MRRLIRLSLFSLARLGLFLAIGNTIVCQFGVWNVGSDWKCLIWSDEIGIGVEPDIVNRIEVDQYAIKFFPYGSHYGGNKLPSSYFPGIDYIRETWLRFVIRIHHGYFILASGCVHMAVKLIYRKKSNWELADE